MRRWIWVLALGLCAFTPLYVQHGDLKKVDDEFKNAYAQAQSNQFKVVLTTPNLMDLKDDEVVICSSGGVKMFFRSGQEIYSIQVSCVTVRR